MIEAKKGSDVDYKWDSKVRLLATGAVGCEGIVGGQRCSTGSTLLLESPEATCHPVSETGEFTGGCPVPRGSEGFGNCNSLKTCSRNLMGTDLFLRERRGVRAHRMVIAATTCQRARDSGGPNSQQPTSGAESSFRPSGDQHIS